MTVDGGKHQSPEPLPDEFHVSARDTGAVGERPDFMQIHDGGCQCWPHVSQRDAVQAIERVALTEYRDGLRRSGGAVEERPDSDEQTYTEDEYIDYGAVQYRRGRAQAEYEAAHPAGGAVGEREEPLDPETLRLYDTVHVIRAVLGHEHVEPWPCPMFAVDEAMRALARKHGLIDRPIPSDLKDNYLARLSVNEGGVAPVEPQESE